MDRAPFEIRVSDLEGSRSVTITARFDEDVGMLALPEHVIDAIGSRTRTSDAWRARGSYRDVRRVAGVRLAVLGRDTACDALVISGENAVVGPVALLALGLVVDPSTGAIGAAPESRDEPLFAL